MPYRYFFCTLFGNCTIILAKDATEGLLALTRSSSLFLRLRLSANRDATRRIVFHWSQSSSHLQRSNKSA
jgi:hypothetical protein